MKTSAVRIVLIVVPLILVGVGVAWYQSGDDQDTAAVDGWPEQVSLTCQACENQFDVSSAQYLEAFSARSDPAASEESWIACPKCASAKTIRTEHLKHKGFESRHAPSG